MRYLLLTLMVLSIGLTTCKKVPITGRRQVKLLPSTSLNSMAFSNYYEFLRSNRVVNGTAQAQQVKEVGVKIQRAVESYFRQTNQLKVLEGFK